MIGKKVNKVRQQTGFTIIELMVALTIAAVMMAFALPAFNDFTSQRRMAANVNLLVTAIGYARSEATRLGARVTVQAIDASDGDNEWGPGFCVTVDDPGNCDDPLRTFALEIGSTLDGIDAYNNEDGFTFNSRGLLVGAAAGNLQLCGEDADDDPGRTINMNALGRTNVVDLTCFP